MHCDNMQVQGASRRQQSAHRFCYYFSDAPELLVIFFLHHVYICV
jgi:hypothetical protein